MFGAITLAILLMAQRGEFIAQGELPFLDALPLDYPARCDVIQTYCGRAQKECEQQGAETWWEYRAATRLFLRDLPPEQAGYMLGRLQGRHYLWQCGHEGWHWIDREVSK